MSKRNQINTMLVTLSELIVDKLNQLDTTQKATFTLLEDTKAISYITYKSLTGELTPLHNPDSFNLTLKHLNDVEHNNPDTMVSDTLRFGILNPNKQEELQVFANKFANLIIWYEPYTNKTKQSVQPIYYLNAIVSMLRRFLLCYRVIMSNRRGIAYRAYESLLTIGIICNTIVMDIPYELGYTRFIN